MLIQKVLNNSMVMVNDNGEEKIIMGKGIGFQNKAGNPVDPDRIEKVYSLQTEKSVPNYEQLAKETPEIYFEISSEITEYVSRELKCSVSGQLFLSLADHISYAVERFGKGIVLQNRLLWEVKAFYAREFKIGLWVLNLIKERIGIELPEEEAGNIAFHLVNAQSDVLDLEETMLAVTMMKDILSIITLQFPKGLVKESIHYSRMITHLQFFLQRVLEDKMLKNQEIFMFNQYAHKYPEETSCVENINQYVKSRLNMEISIDEKLFLLVHITRSVRDDSDK